MNKIKQELLARIMNIYIKLEGEGISSKALKSSKVSRFIH